MPTKVNVLGYYGYRNSGDEAFKTAFRSLAPDVEFNFVSQLNPDVLADPAPLVFGAGDIVEPFFLSQLKAERPFEVIGAGLPFGGASLAHLEPYRGQLRRLVLRSTEHTEIAQKAGYDPVYAPDLVFALDPEPTAPILPIERLHKKMVVVCVADNFNTSVDNQTIRNHAYGEFLKWELANFIEFAAQYNDVVFLGLSFDQSFPDIRMAQDIYFRINPSFRRTVHVIDHEYSPPELIAIMKTASVVVSMKFHGLVYSLVAGRPCINLAPTSKTQRLMLENGLASLNTGPYGVYAGTLKAQLQLAEKPEMAVLAGQIRDRNKAKLQELSWALQSAWSPAVETDHTSTAN